MLYSFSRKAKMSNRSKNLLQIEDRDVYCRNGCQFYGNPEWEGYCSKCYKEIRHKQAHPNQTSESRSTDFHTFEGKKSTQQKRAKTFKDLILKRASTLKESSTFSLGSSTGPVLRDKKAAEGLAKLREELFSLVELEPDSCQEVLKILNSALEDMEASFRKGDSIQTISDVVQNVYQNIYDRVKITREANATQAVELCENFLVSHTYDVLFGVLSAEEESRDLKFLQRVRSLHWIRPHHLDLDVDDIHPSVKEFMDDAITQLILIDTMRSPKEKLSRVVDAAKFIFKMLQAGPHSKEVASADHLVPAMIYIILKANPPRLHTNIKLATLFSAPNRVRSGESGYMFTILCSASQFIEELNAESLQIDPQDFEKFINRKAVPIEDPYTEGARMMWHNAAALEELVLRQNRLADATEQLKSTLESLQQDIEEQVMTALAKTEAATKPHEYTVPSHIELRCVPLFLRDKVVRRDIVQSPVNENLPPPLQPVIVHGATTLNEGTDQ